jgi:putative glutamine amidotransferase
VILISPETDRKGREFQDVSLSLSGNYLNAVAAAGGIPLTMPLTTSEELIAQCVRASDGVMLTGGDDVDPRLYRGSLPARLRAKVSVTPDGGARDYRELVLIREVLGQRKPLLAICRGHQVLNVALGGTLVADIASELPAAMEHRRMDKRSEVAHEVRLTPGSLLASIAGSQRLGVNSTHHQAIARVAAPLRVTAVSTDGVIEGLELAAGLQPGMGFLLSVQFHPERLAGRHREHLEIFRAFVAASALTKRPL